MDILIVAIFVGPLALAAYCLRHRRWDGVLHYRGDGRGN
jgi:hypothetical protein